MKTLIKLSIFFLVVILFSGCIEIKTLVKVNNDGSGTIEETIFMSKEIVDMIGEFASSFAEDSAEAEEFNLFDEEKLKEEAVNFGAGVTYVSGEKLVLEDKEGYKAYYSFNDINTVNIDQNPGRQIPLYESEEGEVEGEFLKFSFTKGDPSELKIILPEKEFPEDDTGDEAEDTDETSDDIAMDDSLAKAQQMEEAKRFLKDLSMSLAIDVEGSIVETNATNVEASEITLFKIDFNELLESGENWDTFIEKDPQTFEEVKEIIKDLPGIKVELNNPVIIKFE